MFERISNSFALARSSWRALNADKKLVVFPMVSGIACLVVLASFAIPMAILHQGGHLPLDDDKSPPWWTWLVLFAFYFCNYFAIVFCNAALVSCAIMRFNGEQPTLGDGFRAAGARLPQIVAWALVSATVGVLLKAIEMIHEKVGEIISALLGTGWTVITYFVVPVLVVEKVGPFQAIGRSLQLLRKAWGEAIVGGVGLGLFKVLLFLPILILLIAGVVLLVVSEGAQPMLTVGLIVLALGLISLPVFAAVSAALDTIFLAALYQFAAFGKVPDGFDAQCLGSAFLAKKAAA